MEIIKWDAYNFRDDFLNEADWKASFLFTNELHTLKQDINEKILKGKGVIFEASCDGGTSKRIICFSADAFIEHIIVNLECNFIIRDVEGLEYRIDLLPANNIEEVITLKPIREEIVH